MEGDRWGRDIAFDITVMLCREIDDGPESVAPLDTPENVLKAIDDMMAEFGDTEELLLMWAGDWFQIEIELNREQPKGYQPQWQLQEPQMSWRIGRYRGHPHRQRFEKRRKKILRCRPKLVGNPGTWTVRRRPKT